MFSENELGGEIRFPTPVQQLVQDDSGKVTGVIAVDNDGKVIQANASKGVIVCTGGYGANDEMLQDLCPRQCPNWCALRNSNTETGDGIRMALRAGAELEAGGAAMIWNRAILPDGFEFDGSYTGGDIFLPGSQPFLHVNINGERFMNEDQCYPMKLCGRREPAGSLFLDCMGRQYWEDIVQFDTCGCSRLAPAPAGTAFNADVYDCEAITPEHLDEFWLNPRIENGSLEEVRHARRARRRHGLRRREEGNVSCHGRALQRVGRSGGGCRFRKAGISSKRCFSGPVLCGAYGGELLVTIHGVITNAKQPAAFAKMARSSRASMYAATIGAVFTRIITRATSRVSMQAVRQRLAALPQKHALGVE